MRCILCLLALLVGVVHAQPTAPWVADEAAGTERERPRTERSATPASARQGVARLLVVESTQKNVMALDPTTGDLVARTLLSDGATVVGLGTPIQAHPNPDGEGLIVCDQVRNRVVAFDLFGGLRFYPARTNPRWSDSYAPADSVDNDRVFNLRACAIEGDRIYLTAADGTQADGVAVFDTTGAYIRPLVTPGAGGLDDPVGLLLRSADVLVSGSASGAVHRYTRDGTFLDVFASDLLFPEQIHETADGRILVAEFVAHRVSEFSADGTLLGRYTFGGLLGLRGVHELPSGAWLVSTPDGVFEVRRDGTVVRAIIEGVSARLFTAVPAGVAYSVADEQPAPDAASEVLRLSGPNPAHGVARLDLVAPTAQRVRVEAFDVLGRRVAVLFDGTTGGGTVRALALTGLAPGVYAVVATGETFRATRTVTFAR